MTDSEQIKQQVTNTFDTVAGGYDHSMMPYFPLTADAIIELLQPTPGNKILDIATGTGMVAMAAAQAVKPGRVQAIDLSENMLARAQINMQQRGIDNIDFHFMDAENPEFDSSSFDAATCSFGIFFLPDIPTAMKNWMRVLKPGGQLIFTIFDANAFQPMGDMFRQDLAQFGISIEDTAWQKLKSRDECITLLEQAGAGEIAVHEKQLGFHLNDSESWWDIIWNSGFRGLVNQIDSDKHEAFKQQHLARVAELATEKGIWLDVMIYIATGFKHE